MLFDTPLLIWAALDDPRLTAAARLAVHDAGDAATFSVLSLWEVAIKHGLRREDFPIPPQALRAGLIASGWQELAILPEHAMAVVNLPPLHGDPFDRLLLAQARVEGIRLVTADRRLAEYGPDVRRV